MNYYLLTAEICFDWSGGEYGNEYVCDIHLGHGYFTLESAQAEAQRLLQEYCENSYTAILSESSFDTILLN